MSEVAWAAGFFDGEGSCFANRRPGGTYAEVIRIHQKDPRPLERFQAAIGGIGRLKHVNNVTSEIWRWECECARARAVMDVLLPYLSAPKREQWEAVLAKRVV